MYTDPIFTRQPTHPTTPADRADLAVFVITTTLCALGALMLPLAG